MEKSHLKATGNWSSPSAQCVVPLLLVVRMVCWAVLSSFLTSFAVKFFFGICLPLVVLLLSHAEVRRSVFVGFVSGGLDSGRTVKRVRHQKKTRQLQIWIVFQSVGRFVLPWFDGSPGLVIQWKRSQIQCGGIGCTLWPVKHCDLSTRELLFIV